MTGEEGGAFSNTSVPTSQGLDVTFNSYQYGGTGADGMAFVLAAVNPANPVIPSAMGQSGGALGYSAQNSNTNGLSYGYLGVGLDAYGNFSAKYEGSGCTDPANIAQRMPGQVVVRGPGNLTAGYCPLQSSAATASSPPLNLRATTRAGSLVPVEVVVDPTSSPMTTASGLTVPAGDYDVHFTPVGGPAKDLVGALPVVPSGLYPASWVSSSGIPKQLVFGWVASTGSITDYHEIDNVVVSSVNPVPQLAVSQTSYTAATLSPGSPVTYTVAASSSGAAENQPVTLTETLPAGVLPVGASGTGWVCGAPSGQQISCTSSTSPFTSGTITVNGVVTSSSLTPALVQAGSTATASQQRRQPGDVVERHGRHGARRAGRHRHHAHQRRRLRRQRREDHRHRPQRGHRHRDRHDGPVRRGHTDHAEPVRGLGARLLHRRQRHQPRYLRPCPRTPRPR